MKKNCAKIASFIFAIAFGCSIASAEKKLPANNIKPAGTSLPVITVPANQVKEKIEVKVVTPAVNTGEETVKTGRETNAPVSDIKNKEDILIKHQNEKIETSEIVPNTAPVVEKIETKQEGTIFDVYGVKDHLKINKPETESQDVIQNEGKTESSK